MSITSSLQGKTAPERAETKARLLVGILKPITFQDGELSISLLNPRYENACLCVDVSCERTGEHIPLNGPFYFYNPPVLVPDGTMRDETTERGKHLRVPNVKEDAIESVKAIVSRAVRDQLYG